MPFLPQACSLLDTEAVRETVMPQAEPDFVTLNKSSSELKKFIVFQMMYFSKYNTEADLLLSLDSKEK